VYLGLKFALKLLGLLLAVMLLYRARTFVLVLSWSTIAACSWLIYVKRYSKNRKLKRWVDKKALKIARWVKGRKRTWG